MSTPATPPIRRRLARHNVPSQRDRRLDERYVLRRALGSGTFGRVFAAWDTIEGREVAIKFFPGADGDRARIESLKAGQVDHPNVVPVLAAGDHDGTPYLVMPLVTGHTLAEHMARGGIAPRSAVRLLSGVAT